MTQKTEQKPQKEGKCRVLQKTQKKDKRLRKWDTAKKKKIRKRLTNSENIEALYERLKMAKNIA